MMAKLSRKLLSKKILYHFSVELLLLTILAITVGANLLQTNSERADHNNQSLFFVYLEKNAARNPKLVDAYGGVNLKLSSTPGQPKFVLAASAQERQQPITDATGNTVPLPTLSGSALMKPNPSTNETQIPNRDVQMYAVRAGDSVARIAASFGVSVRTIIDENTLPSTGFIKVGQELKIPPIDGASHTIKKGETLSGIASTYNVDLEDILEYNGIEIEVFIQQGETIFIPHGVKKAPPTPERQQYLADVRREDYKQVSVPEFAGSGTGLIWPMPAARRLSQNFWGRHRAIDVPCKYCGLVAAADGVVELAGWQGAYGNTVVLNHGGGIKTRVAHLSSFAVAVGQQVSQGQQIGVSGNTGRSSGPHLHFEVIKSGVFQNPLNYVR